MLNNLIYLFGIISICNIPLHLAQSESSSEEYHSQEYSYDYIIASLTTQISHLHQEFHGLAMTFEQQKTDSATEISKLRTKIKSLSLYLHDTNF